MQLYVCTLKIPIEIQDEAYTSFIEFIENDTAEEKSENYELLHRYHIPLSGIIIIVCKANGAGALFRQFMLWRSMFAIEIDYLPALTDEEIVSLQKEHNFKLDSMD